MRGATKEEMDIVSASVVVLGLSSIAYGPRCPCVSLCGCIEPEQLASEAVRNDGPHNPVHVAADKLLSIDAGIAAQC